MSNLEKKRKDREVEDDEGKGEKKEEKEEEGAGSIVPNIFTKLWSSSSSQVSIPRSRSVIKENPPSTSTPTLPRPSSPTSSVRSLRYFKDTTHSRSPSLPPTLSKQPSLASLTTEAALPELNPNYHKTDTSASTRLSQLAQTWEKTAPDSIEVIPENSEVNLQSKTTTTTQPPSDSLPENPNPNPNPTTTPTPTLKPTLDSSPDPSNPLPHPDLKSLESTPKRTSWFGFKTSDPEPPRSNQENAVKSQLTESPKALPPKSEEELPTPPVVNPLTDKDQLSEEPKEPKGTSQGVDTGTSSWWPTFGLGSGTSTRAATPLPPNTSRQPPSTDPDPESNPTTETHVQVTEPSETQPPQSAPIPTPASHRLETLSQPTSQRSTSSWWEYLYGSGGEVSRSTSVGPPPPTEPTDPTVTLNPISTIPNVVLPELELSSLPQTKPQSPPPSPSLVRSTLDTLYYYSGLKSQSQSDTTTTPTPSNPNPCPPPINKVVIIGVHGWFPLKLYQKVIGEPTGTSVRFCSRMVEALKQHLSEQFQLTLDEDTVTSIPLSYDGKVETRVNRLHSQLTANSDWVTALSEADNIFVVAHSQGTPVSVMLMDKLLQDQLFDPARQRVSLLAMAGISHGPFSFLKENYIIKYFEADAARELFEFMSPTAPVVTQYHAAMTRVLASGVKVSATAAMADQVVPLYSGIMQGFHHPAILRTIYIDGINHSPDFLTSLIVFSLHLRNHGLSDQGLLQHLSTLVAGSLYSGVPGHSTIYEELKVYTTALRWHFTNLTTPSTPPSSSPPTPTPLRIDPIDAHHPLNPYYLPWLMRGLLDDPSLHRHPHLVNLLTDLRHQFRTWRPTTKLLKELQFQLDPIKAQL